MAVTAHDKAVRAAALEEAAKYHDAWAAKYTEQHKVSGYHYDGLMHRVRDHMHYAKELRALASRPPGYVAVKRETLEEVDEWLRANPPTDGWGCLDRGADADRDKLRAALAEVLK